MISFFYRDLDTVGFLYKEETESSLQMLLDFSKHPRSSLWISIILEINLVKTKLQYAYPL